MMIIITGNDVHDDQSDTTDNDNDISYHESIIATSSDNNGDNENDNKNNDDNDNDNSYFLFQGWSLF